MPTLTHRLVIFLGLLALILFGLPLITYESDWQKDNYNYPQLGSISQNFSFINQYFFFTIEGNFSDANWTLYQHDLVTNTTFVRINTTPYSAPVRLVLDIGFYTLLVKCESNASITVKSKAYGISFRNICLSLLSITLASGILVGNYIWTRFIPVLKNSNLER
ncbi:MAG: hypothetical protein ACFFCZ_25980 [Promethearchaeota archaeon]